MSTAATASIRRPLFISTHHVTMQRLRKLATAAGVDGWQASDIDSARSLWSQASVVVIDHDIAPACLHAKLPPRDNLVILTGPDLPCEKAWPLAVALGADHVVTLPEAASWLVARMAPKAPPRQRAPVLALAGARGGAGTSTLAVATATAAARAGYATMLIDADRFGGGLDLLLGWERSTGLRWPDLASMSGPFDPGKLRDGLPGRDGLTLLTHARAVAAPIPADQLTAVIDGGRQAHDLVIVDLPRPGVQATPRLDDPANLLTVVVPGELRAVAAARHVIACYAGLADHVCLVTRTPSPAKLSNEQIAHAVSAPVVGSLATDAKLASAGESARLTGRVRKGTLAVVAAALLSGLTLPRSAVTA